MELYKSKLNFDQRCPHQKQFKIDRSDAQSRKTERALRTTVSELAKCGESSSQIAAQRKLTKDSSGRNTYFRRTPNRRLHEVWLPGKPWVANRPGEIISSTAVGLRPGIRSHTTVTHHSTRHGAGSLINSTSRTRPKLFG